MNYLAFYALCVVALLLFGAVVIFNFVRYRFQGDKTWLIIGIFSLAFTLDIIATLSLVHSIALPSS